MPIKVTCQCGSSFAARDELAGRAVKCPNCDQPIRIPGGPVGQQRSAAQQPIQQRPQQAAPRQQQAPTGRGGGLGDLFDEAGLTQQTGPKCPNCRETIMQSAAVMCIHCGFNFQSGEQLHTSIIGDDGEALPIDQSLGNKALDRAAIALEKDAKEQERMKKGGMPWWVFLIGFLVAMTLIITTFFIPSNQALALSGWLLIIIGALAFITFSIWIVVIAFHDKIYHGFGCLFLFPFYGFVYAIAHRDECGGFLFSSIGGILVSTAGWGVIKLAAWIGPGDDARVPPIVPDSIFASTVVESQAGISELSWRPMLIDDNHRRRELISSTTDVA